MRSLMRRYLLVAFGGGIGSLARFTLAQWLAPLNGWSPFPILAINVTGCFIISFFHFVSDSGGEVYLGPNTRIFLLIGFCGGYTTFSSFSLISFLALRQGDSHDFWLNLAGSHLLCLVAIGLGFLAARPFPLIFQWLRRVLRS